MFLVVGLGLVIWPQKLSAVGPQAHARRLAELKAGQPEEFFEEKRALEAYPPAVGGLFWRRLLGGLLVLSAIGLFVVDRLPAEALNALDGLIP